MGNNESTEGYAPYESTSCVPDPVTYVYSFWVPPEQFRKIDRLVNRLTYGSTYLTWKDRCDIHVWVRTMLERTQPFDTYVAPAVPLVAAVNLVRNMTDPEHDLLVALVESTSNYAKVSRMPMNDRNHSYMFIEYAARDFRQQLEVRAQEKQPLPG